MVQELSNAEFEKLAVNSLEKDNYFFFKALGGSMAPWVKPEDLLIIKTTAPSAIKIGQIVLFKLRSDNLAVHRVIGKSKGLFLIKGDALASADGWFQSEAILGKATSIVRKNRKIIHLDLSLLQITGKIIAHFPNLARKIYFLLRKIKGKIIVFLFIFSKFF